MRKSRPLVTLVTAAALVATLVVAGCHSNTPAGVYTDSTGHLTL